VSVPDRGRSYRGVIEATGGGGLRLVNQVDVETYLKGMGEVRDGSWPAASLGAQATAARTYALRAVGGGGELCDDDHCQVYLGAEAEYGAMNRAVDATAHQTVTYRGSLATTYYSANGGGFEASEEEGFGGGGGTPYLVPAPYKTGDPMPWTLRVSLGDVAARFGYGGHLSGAKVASTGPSGRALSVELDGDSGPRSVTGLAFASGLGLKSNLFSLRVEATDVEPPPPPAPGSLGQDPLLGLGPAGGGASAAASSALPVPALPAGPSGGHALRLAAPASGTDPVGRLGLTALAALLFVCVLAGLVNRPRPATKVYGAAGSGQEPSSL